MKPSQLNSKLPSEILAIYQRYRANERVRTLMDKLGLGEMNDFHFFRLFAYVRINELCCPVCGGEAMLASLSLSRIPESSAQGCSKHQGCATGVRLIAWVVSVALHPSGGDLQFTAGCIG
jgi:hypothetical protein